MIERKNIEDFCEKLLTPELFQDYGPNGLQIEGKEKIKRVALAVSATRASVAKAVALKADALIVHHGLFWRFHGARTITGPFAKRIAPLIQNQINLFGYHLPLDAHLEVGNAAQVAAKIEMTELKAFGDYKKMPTGVQGVFKTPLKVSELKEKLESVLNHQVIFSGPDQKMISSMGIITGGANSEWVQAHHAGLDAYLTGEMSEHDWHESAESEITMFAGGHNATEQFGVQALGEKLKDEFGLEVVFIPSENPA